jgi:GT2 family glycosyltransferase
VFALVRRGGRPAGLLRLAGDAVVTPARLRAALAAQLRMPGEAAPACRATPVSVVVCTHERPEDLRRCLDGLLPAAAAGHQVIVVDNAPRSERTLALVARYPFRYLCEPRVGLDYARNRGLRAAKHAIVAYTDDDAVPDSGWVDAIAQPFADPEVGCVTGLVLPLELNTRAQERFELYCAHRRSFARRVFAAPATPPAAAGIVGMGANMGLRRDMALRLGGFDTRLDGGTPTRSGGDTDIFARVLDAGARIVYTPDALVWHRHRSDEPALRRCIFGYGVGLYSFLTKRIVEQWDIGALPVAARWLLGPIVKAAWRYARGDEAVPPVLLALEAAGACLGPLRYLAARRSAVKSS